MTIIKPNKVEVANRLKEIRSDLSLSMSEFGLRIGNVKKSTVNSWIRGLALPPTDKVQRIALISNTTPEWILWGDEKPLPLIQSPVVSCPICQIEQDNDIFVLTKYNATPEGSFTHACDSCHEKFIVDFIFTPYIKTHQSD